MRKIIIYIIFFISYLIPNEIFKEIKIQNSEFNDLSFFTSLGIDIDHVYKTNEYIQFAINEYDLQKLDLHNVLYNTIHQNLEEYYQSRLIQNNSLRDFENGSMGGYYTFNEIEEHLDELTSMYPNIFSPKVSIGNTLENRNIWVVIDGEVITF